MVIIVELTWASFVISESCDALQEATGGIAIESCRFQAGEARLFLARPLKGNTHYALTLRIRNPDTIIATNV